MSDPGADWPPPGPPGAAGANNWPPPNAANWPPPGSTAPPGPPGAAGPGGPGAPPPRRAGGRLEPKHLIWAIAIAVIGLILLRTHHISSIDVILFCVIVPSIILHEISHGWVALMFGDDTAKRAGRLSLNPLVHIDLVGTIIVPALMALSGLGMFGWAKPVPVTVGKLRNPRNHGVLVSLAGPATNVVLAALAYGAFRLFDGEGAITSAGNLELWAEVVFYFGLVNIWLAVFNMIPIPPLDGSVLFERLLPRAWWPGYLRLRQYAMPVLIGFMLLSFYLHPGPLGWMYTHVFNWWANILGL